ncbi:type IV pilus modification protein PilV [Ectothiorhodospira lacustris]|uniref:type IV pilus modification protein PilV n=1 Tax=Ectothiorhodospira lacustris TaxID=2899127 RepID=UPI001EE95FF7|nr:type IV pilus modification protein PilV [Ectothiorhodospira lacustris]MCG5509644.1 type IV pilus modification protein PilV [Ectothiorhodospira lacustris]MCG5521561.1 type IV pilus modification protein PilV [Ectothiorhodospira lacustris]
MLPACAVRYYRTGRYGGFSLTEVLVALVVLSIGLLGLAALQLNGLKGAHSAYQRTLASVIAVDAGERLWLSLSPDYPFQDPEDVEADWLGYWQDSTDSPSPDADKATLPGFSASSIDPDPDDGGWIITVRWSEGRFDEPSGQSVFEYRLTLPTGGGL